MAKIEKESHRQVVFSTRRAGLFNKASELCTLCGVKVAIIVFSLAKKPFSLGHPNVYSVLDLYRNNTSFPELSQPQENTVARSELSLVLSQVEEENKKGEAMRKASKMAKWLVEEMRLRELQEMKSALEELRNTMAVSPPCMNTMSTVFSCIYNCGYGHASS